MSCLQENEQFLMDSPNNINEERRSLYCISVPGLNSWAKETMLTKPTVASVPEQIMKPSLSESCKRSQEDEDSQSNQVSTFLELNA